MVDFCMLSSTQRFCAFCAFCAKRAILEHFHELLRNHNICKIANAQWKQTSQLFQNHCVELSIQKSTILSLLFYQKDIFHKIDTP